MGNNMCCPKCGNPLVELADGKRYCKSCQTQYFVVSKSSTQPKEKSSGPLIALLLLLVLLLGSAGGFAVYHYFFGNRYIKYIEKEFAAYQAAGSPPPLMSADEAAAQNSMREGDPVEVMGIVEGIGDNLISLNNGVNCYIVPEALSAADAAKLEPALGAVHVGDVVGMNGMLCDTDPFTLKYCGLPYQYYEGNKFYTEYEGFRRTGTYPDITFDAETFNSFIDLINTGDVIYQTAPDVLNAFRAGGDVTAASFAQGADTYRDKALKLSGKVTGIGASYINIEGICCFYFIDLLTDADIELMDSIMLNDYVTIIGLVTNPSVDAFRLSYCTVTERVPAEGQAGQEGPGAISDALYQALLREEQFWNQDIGEYAYCDSLSTMPGYTYETASFAIVDMNGDGKNEAVLRSVPRESEDDHAYMVLYEDNGAVYGKYISVTCSYVTGLQIGGLQTNGLFWSPTGGVGSGYLCRCEISGDQLEVIHEALMEEDWRLKAAMGEPYTAYSESADDTYWIRGREDVTKEEFYDYLDQVGWKDDGSMEAEFYDYTTEHILALLRE